LIINYDPCLIALLNHSRPKIITQTWLYEKLRALTSQGTRETDNTTELVYTGVYD